MEDNAEFKQELFEMLKSIGTHGVYSAAEGFSSMVGRQITVANPVGKLVPILSLPAIIGGEGEDAVGIYLRFDGDINGQIMMIMPPPKAMELVDLLMEQPPGTTTHLGSMERSALGELGNLCGTFFLNSIAANMEVNCRPTPPAVIIDMVGSILDVLIVTAGTVSEDVLLIRANFMDGPRSVEADFCVIPDMNTLKVLIDKNPDS